MAKQKAKELPARLMAEIGRASLKQSGGLIMEEYDPDLRSIRGVRIYDQMRKSDPVIATGLRLITWTITQSKWRVDPGGKSSADVEAAKFLESCMHDMSSTWIDFIR